MIIKSFRSRRTILRLQDIKPKGYWNFRWKATKNNNILLKKRFIGNRKNRFRPVSLTTLDDYIEQGDYGSFFDMGRDLWYYSRVYLRGK